MAMYVDGKRNTLYKDDYRPTEMYKDGEKVCGWVEETFEGRSISAEGTYNDELLLTCKGEHSQKSGYIAKVLQLAKDLRVRDGASDGLILELADEITLHAYGTYFSSGGQYSLTNYVNGGARLNIIKGHKYYVDVHYDIPSWSYLQIRTSNSMPTPQLLNGVSKGIVTATADSSVATLMIFMSNMKTFDFYIRPSIIDLTDAFGIGNEPTTVQEVETLLGTDFYYPTEIYDVFVDKKTDTSTPSPQYPQEIVPTKAESKIRSKNILPVNYAYQNLNNGDYVHIGTGVIIPIKPNTNYVLSYDSKILIENKGVKYRFRLDEYDENNNLLRYSLTGYTETDEHISLSWKTLSKTAYLRTVVQYNPYTTNPTRYEFHNIQLEEGDMETPFTPYRTPQELITEYELYGSDGVCDTLEPCVLVDGEWKCRVTRHWRKVTYTNSSGSFGAYPKAYIVWINVVNSEKNTPYKKVYCDKLTYVNTTMGNMNPYEINNENGAPTTKCVSLPLTITSKAEADAWLTENPITLVYPVVEPTIELYDPIMLYTNPYATIINGNTEMIATMKTEDYSESELLSLLSEEYERAIGEL